MLKKLVYAATIFVLITGFGFLAGCEKREYHKHKEVQHHDVVIDEGPVVE